MVAGGPCSSFFADMLNCVKCSIITLLRHFGSALGSSQDRSLRNIELLLLLLNRPFLAKNHCRHADQQRAFVGRCFHLLNGDKDILSPDHSLEASCRSQIMHALWESDGSSYARSSLTRGRHFQGFGSPPIISTQLLDVLVAGGGGTPTA